MLVKEILRKLDLGSSVAEKDSSLESYFVETEPFRALISGKYEVIAGDKGTGKSALYRILSQRYAHIPELSGVEVVSAFNPVGAPVFQKLDESDILDEVDYIKIWKAYFLALGGNWILELADGDHTDQMVKLNALLEKAGLRTKEDNPRGVFTKIVDGLKRFLKLNAAEANFSVAGVADIGGRIEFAAEDVVREDVSIDYGDALRLLDDVLAEMDTVFWLPVDRLDEAFQGRPQLEQPVLRALLRTYLDMQELSHTRLKLFVRRDLFRRIVAGGFVNLTHVNASKIEIVWDDADLYSLLYRRVIENESFVKSLGLPDSEKDTIFNALFPAQVDPGDRKPTTWTWIMGRIGDGNQVKPPRNLIDLILKAREAQLRQEDREPREYKLGEPLITSEALKRGLEALSQQRVEDTLLAESGEYAELIERFRDGKAEHNKSTLAEILGDDYLEKIKYLQNTGFLEQVGSNYKIPILYRSGLEVTQGKAFG